MDKFTDRELIDLAVVHCTSVNDLAEHLGCSRQWIHRMKTKGIHADWRNRIEPLAEQGLEKLRGFVQ